MERERALPVGIVVRRTPGVTRWAPWSWRAVAALPGAGPADWREMRRETVDGRDAIEYHAATGMLELHRAECEGYADSLDSDRPSIWAVFRRSDDAERPWTLHCVTASSFEALDLLESGEELVERIPLTPELAGWIAEFVEAHWKPEKFRKRRRAPATLDGVESGRGDPRIRQSADVFRAPGALKPGGER